MINTSIARYRPLQRGELLAIGDIAYTLIDLDEARGLGWVEVSKNSAGEVYSPDEMVFIMRLVDDHNWPFADDWLMVEPY